MRARAGAVAVLAACCLALAGGCAGSAPPSAPAASAAPAASTPPGQVRITGAVGRPSLLSVAALAAMPSQTVGVEFGTDKGAQRHTYLGTPLAGLIDKAGPVLIPGVKHDELSLGVLVVGADGYRALLSYGELSPGFGNTGVLLATSQDGKPLTRPRLVLPRDVNGGRYVSDVVEIDVIHPPSVR